MLQRRFRRRRMEQFADNFQLTAETTVLDVGGDLWNWQFIAVRPRLTILNVYPPPPDLPPGVTWIVGDAMGLPFSDETFDIAYSNSVIEHLGTAANQQQFAREIRRVARRYYVQTPSRWFPIEPHLMVPFIHYMPRAWQRPLYPLTPWALMERATPDAIERQFQELRLLTGPEFRTLFPSADILTERFAGMAKSFIAQTATTTSCAPG